MTPDEMREKLERYEGLVISTTRYWRHMITSDMADEDIAQELRVKVWRALQTFDPSRGYPEHKHVFGAVRNRIKDLTSKKRRESYETATASMHHDNHETDAIGFVMAAKKKHGGPSGLQYGDGSDLLDGLEEEHQRIAIMMVQGYNSPEISHELQLNINYVRSAVSHIREHVAERLADRSRS